MCTGKICVGNKDLNKLYTHLFYGNAYINSN